MTLTRRRALTAASAIIPAALLAACGTVATTPGALSVNVAQVSAWGQAFINSTSLIAALPGISGTPQAAVIMAIAPVATADLAAFGKAAGNSVTLTFDAGSVPAAVTSLLNDGSTLLTDAQAALPSATGNAVSEAGAYIMALQTIVMLFKAAASSVPAAPASAVEPMSEKQALATLGVSK